MNKGRATSMRLTDEQVNILNARVSKKHPRAQVIGDIICRYNAIVARHLPALEEAEWNTLRDVLAGLDGAHLSILMLDEIFDRSAPPGWEDLRAKLRGLDYTGRVAVADWLERERAE